MRLLARAGAFEAFLARRFPRSKRFGLEGIESLLVGVAAAAERCSAHGVTRLQVGTPHRGRLNMLANVLGTPAGQICAEMEATQSEFAVGDVKYHLGRAATLAYGPGPGGGPPRALHVSVAPNPSHLEAVGPVVLGMVWGRGGRRHRTGVVVVEVGGLHAVGGSSRPLETLPHPLSRSTTPPGARAASHPGGRRGCGPARPRRRRVFGAGYSGGNPVAGPGARLRDGGDAAHRRQQPGGVYHAARAGALRPAPHRPGSGGRRRRSARLRRRPRRCCLCLRPGGRLEGGLAVRRCRRRCWLSSPRPQRAGRPRVSPARHPRRDRSSSRSRGCVRRRPGGGRCGVARRRGALLRRCDGRVRGGARRLCPGRVCPKRGRLAVLVLAGRVPWRPGVGVPVARTLCAPHPLLFFPCTPPRVVATCVSFLSPVPSPSHCPPFPCSSSSPTPSPILRAGRRAGCHLGPRRPRRRAPAPRADWTASGHAALGRAGGHDPAPGL